MAGKETAEEYPLNFGPFTLCEKGKEGKRGRTLRRKPRALLHSLTRNPRPLRHVRRKRKTQTKSKLPRVSHPPAVTEEQAKARGNNQRHRGGLWDGCQRNIR